MPVEILNDKGARRRLRFLRNTAYEGVDYGPGLDAGDVADVDSHWSAVFLANERAVLAEGDAGKQAAPVGEVQVREPAPEHRDPQLPLTEQKKN